MSGIEAVKDLVKPPFANYDIVVYFGCGLFSLPFMMHYVGDLRLSTTSFKFNIDPPFVSTLITTLTVLFSVYILGHIIAYLGSQLIEKVMDSLFGKASAVILRGAEANRDDFKQMIQQQIRAGISRHIEEASWFSSIVRFVCHTPILPAYVAIYMLKVFGFYRTRISEQVVIAANGKVASAHISEIRQGNEWFKSLEAVVMNTNPSATARMYNYLVISGLFRSVSIILLASSWFEMVYTISKVKGYDAPEGLLMFGNSGIYPQLISYSAMCVVYLFSLFSYLKLQRRYVEDAIFAFVYAKP